MATNILLAGAPLSFLLAVTVGVLALGMSVLQVARSSNSRPINVPAPLAALLVGPFAAVGVWVGILLLTPRADFSSVTSLGIPVDAWSILPPLMLIGGFAGSAVAVLLALSGLIQQPVTQESDSVKCAEQGSTPTERDAPAEASHE